VIDDAEGDAAGHLLEHRWFAATRAAKDMQAECETLRDLMQFTEGAWRRARSHLVSLEALRDALGEELAERDGHRRQGAADRLSGKVSSAA
jgi:hypothetical protein